MREFMGYEREDGRVGVRNHVLVLPIDDISNAAAEGVAKLVNGTIAIPHPYGRLQFGKDLELLFHTLIGTGKNPNIAAALVIGIEPNWTNKVADGIAKTGKPVEALAIERTGDLKTIEKGARIAKRFVQGASERTRKKFDLSNMMMSIKCGESDTTTGLASNPVTRKVVEKVVDAGGTVLFGETSELTGGEHIVAKMMASEALREKFLRLYDEYVGMIKAHGVDLLGSQPTQGNIFGGLSTIEEKGLGNIEKVGGKVSGVLDYLDEVNGKGLIFVNTSSAAAECVTLMAAKGSVIHLFPTGQGNVVGHPTIPVIKITGNPKTAETMNEHIDIDVSDLLRLKMNLQQAGDMAFEYMLRVANGRMSAAEVLRHIEFSPKRLYPSA